MGGGSIGQRHPRHTRDVDGELLGQRQRGTLSGIEGVGAGPVRELRTLPVAQLGPRWGVELLIESEQHGEAHIRAVDRMLDGQGAVLLTIPVMGAFDVRGDLIVAWRDYFETAGLAPPYSGPGALGAAAAG